MTPRDRVAAALETLDRAFSHTAYPWVVLLAHEELTKAITDWADGRMDGA